MNLHRIYITGCDCTGKSTLARMYSEVTGLPITKFSKPKNEKSAKEDIEKFSKIASGKEHLCILDRAWNGRFAYRGVLEQCDDGMSRAQALDMCIYMSAEFTKNGGTILLLDAHPRTILQRMNERGDEFIKPHQVFEIQDNYNELRQAYIDCHVPFYSIDTSHLF